MSTTNPQHAQKVALPIDEHLPHIAEQIKSSQNLVITAAPGAGKTTRVPSLLLQIFQGKILVLEPRRIAALGAAFRIAEENQWELGGSDIGYQVRFEKKLSDATRLIFLTEAMLAKILLKDPELRGIDCIVIDEFHERSLHTDLALGYLRELQILGHPIKLVVMSATLDAQSLGKYLGTQDQPCPIVSSAGRLFPLQIETQKNSLSLVLHQNFYLSLAETIQKALSKSQRDLLVFLPGVGEIRRAIQACEHLRKDFILAELHGGLDLDEQRQVVLGKTGGGKRRIIFSTNIAESAITIDGVDAVVDCGLEKVAIEDPFTQFTSLELSRISMASAHQRAGRAARQFPGVCFRMWNTLDQQSMPEMPTSEVQCKDLSDAILWLILMGIQDPSHFSWYENPPNYLLETARQKLAMLNLIELQSGLLKATPLGEMVAQIPLTASMARMCLISETSEQAVLAARTAIILDMGLGDRRSGGDQQSENDLWPILEDWKLFPRHHPAAKAVDQILSILRSLPIPSNSVPLNSPSQMTSHEFTEFLCQAIPHLLCRRRSSNDPKADKSPRAILTNGKGMILKDESSVRKSEFFFALSGQARRGQDTLISCAVGIDKSLIFKTLDHQIKTTNETYYDRERQTFY
ncbi:MAG TPA: helicase-related protein, partial [Pseudobdellovibrionaceae bacterium]|nr:helicase-related protein [Pseudobdellovibrionaceae bacterium]